MKSISLADELDKISARRIDRKKVAKAVRALSTLKSQYSVITICIQWGIIASAVALAIYSNHWALYVLAICVVATRQHALGVLVHDAAHFRLFKNTGFNDCVSDWLCAFPLGMGTSTYRASHLRHHANVNSEDDPDERIFSGDLDWIWPKSKPQAMMVFLRDLIGLNCRVVLKYIHMWSPFPRALRRSSGLNRLERLQTLLWLSLLFSALIWVPSFWFYYLVLWLVPQWTVLTAVFRVRALAEHYCLPKRDELSQTRTVIPARIERWIFAPLNVNYHLEHHLFPSVPFYNLPELHQLLIGLDCYSRDACIADGYFLGDRSVISDLTRARASDSSD